MTRPEIAAYVAARLPKLKLCGAQYRGPCPIHDGTRDSFSIHAETGLWCCHSACGRGGSLADLKMLLSGSTFQTAVSEIERITGSQGKAPQRVVVAEYVYRDESGAPLYKVCRTEPKGFYQQRWSGSQWVNGLAQVRRVLYRLPEIVDAPIVFLVEGEKDVETLREQGFAATTNAGGAGAPWLDDYTDALRGREVIIIPDNDAPGWERARSVAGRLLGAAARIRVFDLPAEIKDISDWFAAGHSEYELLSLA